MLIPTFRRNELLEFNLSSLSGQNLDRTELIVLDDGHELDVDCRSLAKKFGCRYIHSGASKSGELWRIPGFAINIGARVACGEYIIICTAEMYHVNSTISLTLECLSPNNVVIPEVVYDDRGDIIEKLRGGISVTEPDTSRLRALDPRLPFFMGFSRDSFIRIGGYDEDFTGVCWDDNDITDRLIADGGKYVTTSAQVVHLFHNRHNYRSSEIKKRWLHNKHLYDSRKGTVVRNQDRIWGRIS
jgi:GT2 family glycosyltransferase